MEKILIKDLKINSLQKEKLSKFYDFVVQENKKFNLTSITDEKEFWLKHIYDSITILTFFDLKNKKIIDVGTGAGIPGIILAIMEPESEFTLIDSNSKKINFINEFIEKESIQNVKTLNKRVEDIKGKKFDIAISRAVAPLEILIEICSGVTSEMIFYKSKNYKNEINLNWELIYQKIKVKLNCVNTFMFENEFERTFVNLKSFGKPEKGFPREYKKIRKVGFFGKN